MWPCIVINFFVIKPTRCTNFTYWSCSKALYKPVWHIPLLSVQWINSWWWADEISEICRISWQNIFVKLVLLVGFITKGQTKSFSHLLVCNFQKRTFIWPFCIVCLGVHVEQIVIETNCTFGRRRSCFPHSGRPWGTSFGVTAQVETQF
jgi:hypothetical protein